MTPEKRFEEYAGLNARMRNAARELGKTPLHLECLAYIAQHEPTTSGEVNNALQERGVSQSRASNAHSDLMRESLVSKKIDSKDQRGYTIAITEKGRKVYDSLMDHFR